ncbi:ribosomal RNA small subunit methyltransferase I [Erysipelotrichaceae bacterium]|nr:ribosomal RNA small subunit methyltransferase I [Erysipelotrichaceae bacterium]
MYKQNTVKAMENGGLYLVPTPIGNLDDMTFRAVEILKMVDYILAEDTRVTQKLLNAFSIVNKVVSCHEHNQFARIAEIIADIENGKQIALVSDAGMPCISDPGSIIVEALIAKKLPFTALPGASASITLFAVSGLGQKGRFVFHGFLPPKRNEKLEMLKLYEKLEMPVIFYESPHRIVKTLIMLKEALGGESKICLARELTKLYETLIWFTLDEIDAGDFEELTQWKGEVAFAILPIRTEHNTHQKVDYCWELSELIREGMHPKLAIKAIAEKTGEPKNIIYANWQIYKEKKQD